jgi:hypothetical protein
VDGRENELPRETRTVTGGATEPAAIPTLDRRQMLTRAIVAIAGVMGGLGLMHLARIDTVVTWAEASEATATRKAIRRKAARTIARSPGAGSARTADLDSAASGSDSLPVQTLTPASPISPGMCACNCSCLFSNPMISHDNSSFGSAATPARSLTWGAFKARFRR